MNNNRNMGNKFLDQVSDTGNILDGHVVSFKGSILPGSTITVTEALCNNFVTQFAEHVNLASVALLDIKL